MSKLTDAADAIKQYVAQHQAIIDLGAIVGEIGSVEQARDEAIAARDAARGELADVRTELAKARTDYQDAVESRAEILSVASTESQEIITNARQEAENILTAGRTDAQNLRDVAKNDIASDKMAALNNLEIINNNVAAKRQDLIDLNVKIDAAKTTLAEAESNLAAVKQNAQRILG